MKQYARDWGEQTAGGLMGLGEASKLRDRNGSVLFSPASVSWVSL